MRSRVHAVCQQMRVHPPPRTDGPRPKAHSHCKWRFLEPLLSKTHRHCPQRLTGAHPEDSVFTQRGQRGSRGPRCGGVSGWLPSAWRPPPLAPPQSQSRRPSPAAPGARHHRLRTVRTRFRGAGVPVRAAGPTASRGPSLPAPA